MPKNEFAVPLSPMQVHLLAQLRIEARLHANEVSFGKGAP